MKRYVGILLVWALCVIPVTALAATSITTRAGVGRSLTWTEMDGNFSNLRTAIDTNSANLGASLASLLQSQTAGTLGYQTVAAMNADLAHPANTIALVTNDPTSTNNTYWIKLGASGTGSWQKSSQPAAIPLVNASLYADFATAVSAQGTTMTTLVVSASMPVTTAVSVPTTINLMFVGTGSLSLSGSGAVTGLKESRPEWFGAVGNGIADDAAAVQNAINASRRAVLSKNYLHSKTLYIINDYQEIVTEGVGQLTSATTLTGYSALTGLVYPSSVVVYQANYVKIIGIRIDQSQLTTANCDGILFYKNSTNGIVSNSRIVSSKGDAIHFYDGCNDAQITKNTVTGSALDGILFHARSYRAVISDNIVRNTAIVPIEIEGRIGTGDTDLQPCTDVVVTGNVISNDTFYGNQGIMIDWSSGVVISGNTLKNVLGVQCIGASNTSISHNTFEECWNLAVFSAEGFTSQVTSKNIVVDANVFNLSAYPGSPRWNGVITLDAVDGATVSNNTMKIANLTGIAIRRTATAQNIAVRNNTTVGIPLFVSTANNMVISGNTIQSPFGAPILTFPSGNLSNLVFTDNTIDQNNTIVFNNASSTITNLNFSRNTFKSLSQAVGVFFQNVTLVRAVISNNIFYDTANTPLHFDVSITAGADSIVSNNIAKGTWLGGKSFTNVGNYF
ncbi:MAG: right-handed parallel beta-helix repeat-containing protein [Desulfuromonadales bacterium]|nr:right-handed parallel beta-helix repeat-containing protein [Desulfuromonadales bacterium]